MASRRRAAGFETDRLLCLKSCQARRRTLGVCCSPGAISARFLLESKRVTWLIITKDSSNLWPSPQTYQCWGFQRPMPKRTPPSDDIPLERRCAFGPSAGGVPARWKRDQRPGRVIVIGGPRRPVVLWPRHWCRGRRNRRQTQICKSQIHDDRPAVSRWK